MRSIAEELVREAFQRIEDDAARTMPEVVEKLRARRQASCQCHDERRKRCTRPPVVRGRICAECWRGMMRRAR